MAQKNIIGKKAYIKELKKIGTITEVDSFNNPIKVDIDGEIIDVVKLTVKLVGLLKSLFLLIKSIFKK